MHDTLNTFIELIRNLFISDERNLINEKTDLKLLKEWSSLQIMIVVNEIDKTYNVLLTNEDFLAVKNLEQLYKLIQYKKS